MSKKIASRGEEGKPGLQEILARLVETAQKVEEFISRYKATLELADQVLKEIRLRDFEPYFGELMRDFHRAMKDLQILARSNLEAQCLVRKMLFIECNAKIGRIQCALGRTSQVASRHLARHYKKAEAKKGERKSKRPGTVLSAVIIAVGYIHFYLVLDSEKRRKLLKNKYS